jgi:ABC-type nitrate/sulfonate/bicarbonate transport system substrate-binding protein
MDPETVAGYLETVAMDQETVAGDQETVAGDQETDAEHPETVSGNLRTVLQSLCWLRADKARDRIDKISHGLPLPLILIQTPMRRYGNSRLA